jgi:hypothetical protein
VKLFSASFRKHAILADAPFFNLCGYAMTKEKQPTKEP